MSRFPVAHPRGNRLPPIAGVQNIMMSSDVHLEQPPDPPQIGSYKALDDLNAMIGRPSVLAWVNAGDITSRANESEYDAFHAWMSQLDRNGRPVAIVPGNHDLIGTGNAGGVPDIVTPQHWATRMAPYGVTGRNYHVDVGRDLRILCLSPMDNLTTGIVNTWRLTLDATALEWCDARMFETTRRCIIVFHAPLYGTVGTPETPYNSFSPGWHAHSQDAYTIEQMLAKHPNFIAWVSGHNHTGPESTNNVTSVNLGAGPFAAVSIGSPLVLPIGTVPAAISSMLSVYDDRVEVRFRDHGAGQWLAPVRTVAL